MDIITNIKPSLGRIKQLELMVNHVILNKQTSFTTIMPTTERVETTSFISNLNTMVTEIMFINLGLVATQLSSDMVNFSVIFCTFHWEIQHHVT